MSDQVPGRRASPVGLSQQAHRQLIGYLGFFLPFLLYLLAGLRQSDDLSGWTVLPSVSAYYYTGAVAVFIGVIAALSLFLFTYCGYDGIAADRIVGALGGAGAVGVILFPTNAPSARLTLPWWSGWMATVHYSSAVALFISFILFAIWLFRRSEIADPSARPTEKQWRDRVSLSCGIVMIVAVAWAGWARKHQESMFYQESVAIEAFALSWLVKGEAHRSIARAARKVWRRPGVGQ